MVEGLRYFIANNRNLESRLLVMVLLNSERAAVTAPAAAANATNLRLERPCMSLQLLWGRARFDWSCFFRFTPGHSGRKALTGKLDRQEHVSR